MVFVLVLVIFINQNAKICVWDTFIATLQLLPHHTPTIICIIIGSYIIFTLQNNKYDINVYHVNQFLGAKVSLRLLEFILKQPKCFRKAHSFSKWVVELFILKSKGNWKFLPKSSFRPKFLFLLKETETNFCLFCFGLAETENLFQISVVNWNFGQHLVSFEL